MSKPVSLGFDLSTQSLTVLVISGECTLGSRWRIEKEYCVNYDADLPRYNTKGTNTLIALIV